jgi:LPXTG-motif cell wall-anchored protein
MKKPLAAATTLALAGLTTFALAGPAIAATDIGDATFYSTADFGAETGAGYPANEWFHGQLGPAWTQASVTSSASGLDIVAGAGAASQILNNQSFVLTDVAAFLTDVADIDVHASDDSWVLQIPVFGETDAEFTTLRPATQGSTDPEGAWITSGAITDGGGTPLYAAGASDTLVNLVNALTSGDAPEVLAYGFWVGSDTSVSFYAVDAFDELSVFTPIPTRTVTPNPVTPEQTTTTGLVFTGSGWFPGAQVYIDVFPCEDGDSFPASYDGDAVAGPDGTFSVTVVFDEEVPLGTYCYYIDDDDVLYNADVLPELDDLVVAAAVIEDDDQPQLAATGVQDSAPWLIGGGAVVLLGLIALVFAGRARRRLND